VDDFSLIFDLVLTLGAALLGGFVAARLGQPVILGYIVAGLVIGPNTPGLVADSERVLILANLGVALLMFALGVEFRVSDLLRMRRVALIGAGLQIPLTILLGFVVGRAVGWTTPASLVLGGAFAISSSIVALKVLLGRGEGNSAQARVAIGLSIVQDLSLVPMLALLPVIAGYGGDGEVWPELVRSLGLAGVALALAMIVGVRVVPPALGLVARTGSRELFLLVVVTVALGTALAVEQAGLSLGLGAFLAGIVVSESEFESQVLADIAPIRDVFAPLFFVAVGMLIDPALLAASWPIVLALLAALIVGKLLITGGALLAAGVDHRTATLAAALLAQMGEFSFVLAGEGLAQGIIDGAAYGVILSVALGSIVLCPGLAAAAPRLVTVARRLPGVAAQERAAAGPEVSAGGLSGHTIVCGHGRVGAELGAALSAHGLPWAAIDVDAGTVHDLRRRGVPAVYADAASERALRRVGVERAAVLAIATPDLVTAEAAIRTALALNPGILVIARATSAGEVGQIGAAGAHEVVQPEFEAGMEFVRRVLDWRAINSEASAAGITARRGVVYGEAARPAGSAGGDQPNAPAAATAGDG
jgi:CPA2 family monovalent cation:H+ antiporter-2